MDNTPVKRIPFVRDTRKASEARRKIFRAARDSGGAIEVLHKQVG